MLQTNSRLRDTNREGCNMKFPKHKHLLVYATPCLLALLSYTNSLTGQFVHDDLYAIKHNRDVTGRNPLVHLFQNDFWGTPMNDINSHKSYRPLCVLSFRLDYTVSGGDPAWFHAVNVALHACATLAFTAICLCVLGTSGLYAALSGSLFAVHPIHSEAVAGIVGRADILAALFFLLSLYAFSRAVSAGQVCSIRAKTYSIAEVVSSQGIWLVTTVGLATAAMLCKETGVTVLAVCVTLDLLLKGRDVIRNCNRRQVSVDVSCCLMRCLILIVATVALMVFRLWVMEFQQPQVFQEETNPASVSPFFLTRLLTFTYLPTYNLWLMLCPSTLSYDWTGASIPLVSSLTDPRNLSSLLVYSALGSLVVKCLRQEFQKREPGETTTTTRRHSWSTTTLISISLLVIPFLPASNLFFKVGFVVAERVLYIPSMGYCLLVTNGFLALCARLPRLKPQLIALFCLMLLVLLARTLTRNTVWQSRHSLFWSGVQTLPNNAKMHYNLANLLKDEGRIQEAEAHYRAAIQWNPKVASYHLNLGTILTNKTQARRCYQQALRLQPKHTGALVNLGSVFVEAGDPSGIEYIRQALAIDPNHLEALLVMSSSLLTTQEAQEAWRYIQRALELQPNHAKVRLCHAMYLHSTDQTAAALEEYDNILRLEPNNTSVLLNSAKLHFTSGQLLEAERRLDRAVELSRDCGQCFSLLGSIYSRRGLHHSTIAAFARATALEPNNINSHLKYVQVLKDNQQSEQAWVVLEELLTRHPLQLDLLKFGFSYAMQEKRYAQALGYIQTAISVAQDIQAADLYTLYRDMGEAYRYNNDNNQALKAYEKAFEINSTFVEAITDAATVHFLQKNFAQAESYYLKALSIDPSNSLARQNLQKLRNITQTGTSRR